MPTFKVRLARDYVTRETVDVEIEADDESEARSRAKALDDEGDLEDQWSEEDGGPRDAEITGVTLLSESNDVIETS